MSLFCLLFWHRWRPQSVDHVWQPMRQTTDRTLVLLRCERCSRTRTRNIAGTWTLEQLLLGEEMYDSPASKVGPR